MLLHGRDQARGEQLEAALGPAAVLHLDDLADPTAPQRVVSAALAAFGRLDGLVNNAAYIVRSNLYTTDAALFDRVMAINVRAPMLLIQAGRLTASGPVDELLTRLDLPMAHGREAGAVIRARISGQDEADRLTRLEFSGGELWVPRVELPPGTAVRLRILSRDVSLSLQPPGGSSIINGFAARVVDVADAGPAEVMVRLRAGDETLLTRVSLRAQRLLAIEPGRELYAQVKSVAALV